MWQLWTLLYVEYDKALCDALSFGVVFWISGSRSNSTKVACWSYQHVHAKVPNV